MTLHPSCSSPCPLGMKEMLSKYPCIQVSTAMDASAHWLCPGVRVRDNSLELSFRQPKVTFLHRKVLLLSSPGATHFLEELPLSFPSKSLSQGRGHQSKRPPWAPAWKAGRAGKWGVGWAGCFQSKLRAWAAYWIQVPTGYSCSSVPG